MTTWIWNEAGQLNTVSWRGTDSPDGWNWVNHGFGRFWEQYFDPVSMALPIGVIPIDDEDMDDFAAELDSAAERWGQRLRLAIGPRLRSARRGTYALGLWVPSPAPGWIMLGLAGAEDMRHTLAHELHHAAAHHRQIWQPGEWEAVEAYGGQVRAQVRQHPKIGPGWLLEPGEAEAEGYACLSSGKKWPAGIDARKDFPKALAAWRRLM